MNEQLKAEILGAIARGWCHKNNEHKIMDVNLAEAISIEIEKLIVKNFAVAIKIKERIIND